MLDVFPAMLDEMAAVPLPLPVVVETGPQAGHDPDIQLSGRGIEVGVMDINQDIQVLPVVVETGPQVGHDPDILVYGWDIEVGVLSDVFQVLFDETAAVPLPLPVVIETEPQVGYDPVIMLSRRDIEVGVANITPSFAGRASGNVGRDGCCAVVLVCGRLYKTTG